MKNETITKFLALNEVVHLLQTLQTHGHDIIHSNDDLCSKVIDFTISYNETMGKIKEFTSEGAVLHGEPSVCGVASTLRTIFGKNVTYMEHIQKMGLWSSDGYWSISLQRDLVQREEEVIKQVFREDGFIFIFIDILMVNEESPIMKRRALLKKELTDL